MTHETVLELFATHAAARAEATAVGRQGDTLSYGELDDRSTALAQQLVVQGVRPGDIVGVVMDRCPQLIVGLMAVWKAGAAYLYLDPHEPAEQRERIIADSAMRLAVSDARSASVMAGHVPCVDVTAGAEGVTLPTPGRLWPAYVCYTSGSTGEPKGVVVPHQAIVRLVEDPSWIDIQPTDVFFQLTRVGFDVSTFEIWTPLAHGLRLALGPGLHDDLDLGDLADMIRGEGVTVLWLTTGLFHKVVTHHLPQLAGIRHLLAGGDVLSPAHVQRVMQAFPEMVFTNGYGPTENTTFSTCWTSRQISHEARVPIGAPVDQSTAYILSDTLKTVQADSAGELWVGGSGLALGYLHRPAATAERFVADPTPGAPAGARMYRTGDLARMTSKQSIDLIGRTDRQVKVRGYRVELNAIEAHLLRHEGVEQAAVITRTTGVDDTRLIAYVATGGGTPEQWDAFGTALRAHLQSTVAPHLVPWAIIVRDELPLSQNGKVDRRALPADKIARNVWNDYVAPRNELEERLAVIWSDALGVEPVGVQDNFFDLGGHSLLAAELLAALQRDFDVALPARTLYLRPDIEQLATELSTLTAPAS